MSSSFNLQPDRDFIDAADLHLVVEMYMQDARRRVQLHRIKPKTADGYEYLLSLLLEWWGEAGASLSYELDEDGWRYYAAWLETRRSGQSREVLALSVRKRAIIMCGQLLRWCAKKRILPRDYTDQLPTIEGEKPARSLPDKEGQGRLLDRSAESRRPVRDQAIVAVCLGTGMRRAEAAGLNVEDIEFHADGGGLIWVRNAKLGKQRRVVFDGICGRYIVALLDELGRDVGPLFTQWKDERLSPEGIWRAVKAALQRAGIDERGRGPHELRRIWASEYAKLNPGLAGDKKMGLQLGHSSRRMSGEYVYVTLDDVQLNFTSPLAALDGHTRASEKKADT